MKKALAICLAASMLLSMSGIATAAPAQQIRHPAAVNMMSSRIGEGVHLADEATINALNTDVANSMVVHENNNYVKAGFIPANRLLTVTVNTNDAVKKTNYLSGIKGTGLKTSVQNFLQALTQNRKITAYQIGSIEKTVSGTVTIDQLEADFTKEMQNKLVETTGNIFSPYFGTMEDLSGIGSFVCKIVFTEPNGTQAYIDYTIGFVPGNWTV